MKTPLLYDVFCGAGGATKGYQRAGFRVVGIDIKPQKRYCGNGFIQMDALEFLHRLKEGEYGHEFDAIHASPPCEGFCRLKHHSRGHIDLLTPCRELLKTQGSPWVIENVPGAPMRKDIVLCGTMFGLRTPCGAELWRHRWFETNWPVSALLTPCSHYASSGRGDRERRVVNGHVFTLSEGRAPVVTVTGHGIGVNLGKRVCTVTGTKNKPGRERTRDSLCFGNEDRKAAMGIDWMSGEELVKAIPPAYTEWIGRHLRDYLESEG